MVKVFGIGLSKTGTTSLTAALDILGFRPALHSPWCHAEIALCGSATDLTIAYRFRVLARLWPDAKFILTTREMQAWLASSEHAFLTRWLRNRSNPDPHFWAVLEAVLAVFGTLDFDRGTWEAAYRRHETDVLQFFADMPHRLLVLDITRNCDWFVKWWTLCRFLEVPIPLINFPHENQSSR